MSTEGTGARQGWIARVKRGGLEFALRLVVDPSDRVWGWLTRGRPLSTMISRRRLDAALDEAATPPRSAGTPPQDGPTAVPVSPAVSASHDLVATGHGG